VPNENRGAALLLSTLGALAGAVLGAAGCGSDPAIGSVGAVFGRDNDTHALYVRDVPEGLGAEEAGLLPGDEIVMIDGHYVRDLDRKEITQRLRGEVGTKVDLTVLRGSEVNRISVKRTALRSNDDVKPKEERIDP
jgi:C-terminal processing protease CtpA/Prc